MFGLIELINHSPQGKRGCFCQYGQRAFADELFSLLFRCLLRVFSLSVHFIAFSGLLTPFHSSSRTSLPSLVFWHLLTFLDFRLFSPISTLFSTGISIKLTDWIWHWYISSLSPQLDSVCWWNSCSVFLRSTEEVLFWATSQQHKNHQNFSPFNSTKNIIPWMKTGCLKVGSWCMQPASINPHQCQGFCSFSLSHEGTLCSPLKTMLLLFWHVFVSFFFKVDQSLITWHTLVSKKGQLL